jgi:SAM-dependent methyltransferase
LHIEIRQICSEKAFADSFSSTEIESFSRHRSCPTCGSSQHPLNLASLGEPRWAETLDVVECPSCRAIYYQNPPSDLFFEDYYNKVWNQQRGEAQDSHTPSPSKMPVNTKCGALFSSLGIPSDSKILDVGCGHGGMMAGLLDSGYGNTQGLEQSPFRSRISEQRFPGKILHGGFQDWSFEDHFDVIYSNHVLEHIPVPSRALDWMDKALKPDGKLILFIPNNIYEPVVDQILFLPHLHSFAEETFWKLAVQRGYQICKWLKSPKVDELCVALSKDESFNRLTLNASHSFAKVASAKSTEESGQAQRFSKIWSLSSPNKGDTLIIFPTTSSKVRDASQKWDSFTTRPLWFKPLLLLLQKKRVVGSKYPWIRRGENLINRILSRSGSEIHDYNFVISRCLEDSPGACLISKSDRAPILIK